MRLSISQLLILPILFAILSGCKLAVEVGEGGEVLSASGSRNCAESSVCEHTVTDTDFSDSFTAVAKPGYTFAFWKADEGYVCGNSKNLTCVASNTGLAGNADFEAAIASDAVFKISPVFIKASRSPFVVRDGNGEAIADVIEIRSSGGYTGSVRARLVYTDEEGFDHGYAVLFKKDYIYSDMLHFGEPYYLDSSCTGQQYAPGDYVEAQMGPLISGRIFHWGEPPQKVKLAIIASDTPVFLQYYELDGGECTGPRGPRSSGLYPLTIVDDDLGSNFTPPFGVFAE